MQLGIIVLAAIAALGLIWVWSGAGEAMCMRVQASSPTHLAHLKFDETVKAVIQVSQAASGQIYGQLLHKQDQTHYVRSASTVEARWAAGTKLVMGKSNDIRPGAIIYLAGRLAPDRSIHASQIVVLTRYVRVNQEIEPPQQTQNWERPTGHSQLS